MSGLLSWFWGKKTYDSRIFIDRIHVKASRFPNWEPSFPIKLGDYGTVDRDTGNFTRAGNIFNDGKTQNTSALEEIYGVQDDRYIITSIQAREVAFDAKPVIGIPDKAEVAIKAQFKFMRGRGAVLIMHKPTTTKLEHIDKLLVDGQYEHLRGMCLITEVTTCPAYAMYLSGKQAETVKLVLSASAPIPGAAGAVVGGEVGGKWHSEGVSGVFRCGSQTDKAFTTLYSSRAIGKRNGNKRDLEVPDPETLGKDRWMESVLPWDTLDENGEEIPDN